MTLSPTPLQNPRTYGRIVAVMGAVFLALCGGYMMSGSYALSVGQIYTVLTGGGELYPNLIVWDIRLPRLATCVFVGVLLGMSGAIFQSIIRNPLASPDVIGFTPGVAVGAVLTIAVLDLKGTWIILGATVGGLTTAMLVFALAWKNTGTTGGVGKQSQHSLWTKFWHHASGFGFIPYRIVLVGIGVGLTLSAMVDFMLTQTDIYRAGDAIIWLQGSLSAKSWDAVVQAGIGCAILIPLALCLVHAMNQLEMGDDVAVSLGIHVNRTRIFAIITGTLMVTVAVATAGPLAFIAFVSGPIARRISPVAGCNLILAGLVGAMVTITADLLARTAIPDTELSAGVFTALIGAPYLLWLLSRQIRNGDL